MSDSENEKEQHKLCKYIPDKDHYTKQKIKTRLTPHFEFRRWNDFMNPVYCDCCDEALYPHDDYEDSRARETIFGYRHEKFDYSMSDCFYILCKKCKKIESSKTCVSIRGKYDQDEYEYLNIDEYTKKHTAKIECSACQENDNPCYLFSKIDMLCWNCYEELTFYKTSIFHISVNEKSFRSDSFKDLKKEIDFMKSSSSYLFKNRYKINYPKEFDIFPFLPENKESNILVELKNALLMAKQKEFGCFLFLSEEAYLRPNFIRNIRNIFEILTDYKKKKLCFLSPTYANVYELLYSSRENINLNIFTLGPNNTKKNKISYVLGSHAIIFWDSSYDECLEIIKEYEKCSSQKSQDVGDGLCYKFSEHFEEKEIVFTVPFLVDHIEKSKWPNVISLELKMKNKNLSLK